MRKYKRNRWLLRLEGVGDGVENGFVSAFPRIRRTALEDKNPFAVRYEVALQEIPVSPSAVEGNLTAGNIADTAIQFVGERSFRHFLEKLLNVPVDEAGKVLEPGSVDADLQPGFAILTGQIRLDQVCGCRMPLDCPALRIKDGKTVAAVPVDTVTGGVDENRAKQADPHCPDEPSFYFPDTFHNHVNTK